MFCGIDANVFSKAKPFKSQCQLISSHLNSGTESLTASTNKSPMYSSNENSSPHSLPPHHLTSSFLLHSCSMLPCEVCPFPSVLSHLLLSRGIYTYMRSSSSPKDRWPSWLWRQVKVLLSNNFLVTKVAWVRLVITVVLLRYSKLTIHRVPLCSFIFLEFLGAFLLLPLCFVLRSANEGWNFFFVSSSGVNKIAEVPPRLGLGSFWLNNFTNPTK